jgi:hypothetical protein
LTGWRPSGSFVSDEHRKDFVVCPLPACLTRRSFPGVVLAFVLGAACGGQSSPTRPSVPSIHAQGTLSIPLSFTADLDQGTLAPQMSAADIHFEGFSRTDRTQMFLTPVNGARLSVVGTSTPGRSGCATVDLPPGNVSLDRLIVGIYICARTNEGRYAQLRVERMPEPDSVAGGPAPVIVLEFTTYE